MNSTIHLKPVAEVSLTLDEAQYLIDCCATHGDGVVLALAQVGGVVNRMYALANFEAREKKEGYVQKCPLTTSLRWRDVDTICKALERGSADHPLAVFFNGILGRMSVVEEKANRDGPF